MYIYVNITETDSTVEHITQKVFLDFSSYDINGIYAGRNDIFIVIKNLKIKVKRDINVRYAIRVYLNSKNTQVFYNYLLVTSTNYGLFSVSGSLIAKYQNQLIGTLSYYVSSGREIK